MFCGALTSLAKGTMAIGTWRPALVVTSMVNCACAGDAAVIARMIASTGTKACRVRLVRIKLLIFRLALVFDIKVKFAPVAKKFRIFRQRPLANAIDGSFDRLIIHTVARGFDDVGVEDNAVNQQAHADGHHRLARHGVRDIGPGADQCGDLGRVVLQRGIACSVGGSIASRLLGLGLVVCCLGGFLLRFFFLAFFLEVSLFLLLKPFAFDLLFLRFLFLEFQLDVGLGRLRRSGLWVSKAWPEFMSLCRAWAVLVVGLRVI